MLGRSSQGTPEHDKRCPLESGRRGKCRKDTEIYGGFRVIPTESAPGQSDPTLSAGEKIDRRLMRATS
jgi:hypothetical protein